MSKRDKRRTAIQEHGPLLPEGFKAPEPPVNPAPRPLPLSLADIRTEAMRAQTETSHTIANLEAWRSEIDSTIAFLKARGHS